MTNIWQDSSAIYHTDISFDFLSSGTGFTYALISDSSVNIYAGGNYSSMTISPGNMIPYVSRSTDGGITWQDSSALFNTDISGDFYTFPSIGVVNALTYETSGNRVYAGGQYPSIDSANNIIPFVSWSNDSGITWQDSSAIFYTDISFDFLSPGSGSVIALTFDPSQNIVYAGGQYNSNIIGQSIPFVSRSLNEGITWQDSSAIYITDISVNLGGNRSGSINALAFDTSINRVYAGGEYSLGGITIIPIVSFSDNSGITWQNSNALYYTDISGDMGVDGQVNALIYDSHLDRIYAGGDYDSVNNSKRIPFVSWSSDGITWQDSSAIFNTDISTNYNTFDSGSVTSLTYDISLNRIYAGGIYSLQSSNTFPFVSWSSDGVTWQDSSAIFYTDISFDCDGTGSNKVYSLTYDNSLNRVFAGGSYKSLNLSGNPEIPFVSFTNDSTPPVPTGPPYFSIEFTNSNIFLNGYDSGLPGLTYYLKVTDMSNSATITNITSPLTQVNVKLWADFSNNIPNNIPTGTFIIAGSNITLDGQGLEIDLSYNSVGGYEGLVHVNNGSQGIDIQDINASIGLGYNLSISTGNIGWICQGSMNNVDISFNNCSVTSLLGDIIIGNGGNFGGFGGICGGNNGQNISCSLSFTNCSVSSLSGDIIIDNLGGASAGGILGGNNIHIVTLSITDCSVKSSRDIILNNGGGGDGYNGGIYAGNNTNITTLSITGCSVTSSRDIILDNLGGGVNGGICGGLQNSITTFTITRCIVTSSRDIITRNNIGGGGNGGICGGNNYYITTMSIIECLVTSTQGDIKIVNFGSGYGGICGGNNNNITTFTITHCSVSTSNGSIISENTTGLDGGICGGNNSNITNVNFTDCLVTSNNDITSTTSNNDNGFGGICGGQNIGNYTFTNCNVKTLNGSLSITLSGANSNFGGGICGGQNQGTFNFIECQITSATQILNISSSGVNTYNGGICGGNNSGNNLSFDNCNVIANNINIGGTDNTQSNYNGGICGGNNIGNLLIFTDCRVISNTNIDISGNSLKSYIGGICGGKNDISGTNLTFTNCEVLTKTGDINVRGISMENSYNGGMCGGSNRNTLLNMQTNFNNCQILSNQNISLGGNVTNYSNYNGGICGGDNNIVNFSNCQSVAQNGSININPTNATENLIGGICGGNNGASYAINNSTFTNCQVIANLQIDISGNGARNDNGGICGGANENTKIEFTNCQVNSLTNNIYIRGIGSQSNFNGGICGGENSNQASVDMTFTNCNLVTDELSDINIEYNNTTKFNGGICGGGNLLNPSTSIFKATFNSCDLITGILTISGETINYPLNYAQSNQYIENGLIIGGNNKTLPSTIQIDCESKYIDLDNLNYDLDTCCGRTPPTPTPTPPTPPPPSPLGGGTQGVSLKVLHLMEGGNSRAMTRRVLRSAFGTDTNSNNTNNKTRKCKTPFRVSVNEHCGTEKAPIIYSGADYIRFKKLKAENQTYNDKSYGGDNSHGSYVSLKRARN